MPIAQKARALNKLQGRTVIETLPAPLAKRAVQAQRWQQRRDRKTALMDKKAAKWERIEQQTRLGRIHSENVKNERRWRREDMTLGPLAPRRDVGEHADSFGAHTTAALTSWDVVKPKKYGIVEGDRVVVIKSGHRDQGKIARVRTVDEKKELVTVEDLNMADLRIPDYMLVKEQDKTKIRAYEFPMPLSWVRLVAALPDPVTGQLRDTVIREVKLDKLTLRELKGEQRPTRSVAGMDPAVLLPYPDEGAEATSAAALEAAEEHERDTLRIEVENRTWTPTLHMPPMPPAAIDELRNRFGKFRLRHDDDYLAAVRQRTDAADADRRRRKALMMTPVKQRRLLERLERKARGPPTLSDESLARIGEVMERNMAPGRMGGAEEETKTVA